MRYYPAQNIADTVSEDKICHRVIGSFITINENKFNLIEDILFIRRLQPEMIGIGPFIPHSDTPFARYKSGTMELTLLLLSIFRLMHLTALIPATTALATLAPDGRLRGILAGANVVMPNLSPKDDRVKYSLYDNKATLGAEAAEGLSLLAEQLAGIGYKISFEITRLISTIPS